MRIPVKDRWSLEERVLWEVRWDRGQQRSDITCTGCDNHSYFDADGMTYLHGAMPTTVRIAASNIYRDYSETTEQKLAKALHDLKEATTANQTFMRQSTSLRARRDEALDKLAFVEGNLETVRNDRDGLKAELHAYQEGPMPDAALRKENDALMVKIEVLAGSINDLRGEFITMEKERNAARKVASQASDKIGSVRHVITQDLTNNGILVMIKAILEEK